MKVMRRESATPPRPARKVALWTPWGVMPRDERAGNDCESGRTEEKPRRQPALRSRPAGTSPKRGRAPLT